MKKKALSLLLVLSMCLTLLPTAALADYTADPTEPELTEAVFEEQEEPSDPEEPEDPEQEEPEDPEPPEEPETPDQTEEEPAEEPGEEVSKEPSEEPEEIQDEESPAAEELLAEPVPLTARNGGTLQAGGHTHYLCGGDTCNKEGHAEEENKTTFTAWPGIQNVTTGGKYYLTNNVSGFTVSSGVDLTLCLNGYNIASNQEGPTIEVKPGATLTLCNCNGSNQNDGYITHSSNIYGAGVFVGAKDDSMVGTGTNNAVFRMYGGTISGNSDKVDSKTKDYIYGSGVVVMGGTFYMYGGKITNNRVNELQNKSYGGGVSVYNNGTFNMSGGEITENIAMYGGGVSVGLGVGINHATNKAGGTFTMSGGKIHKNNATYAQGGGVYVSCGSDTHFTVSGAAQITDNKYPDSSSTSGTANNVYLLGGSEKDNIADAIIYVDTLDSSARIGVTTENGTQLVASNISQENAQHFTNDSSDCRLKYDSTGQTLTMISTKHDKHPICGKTCSHNGSHSTVTWSLLEKNSDGKLTVNGTALAQDNVLPGGSYYLFDDLELTTSIQINKNSAVNLDLNGHTIQVNAESGTDGGAIYISSGGSLTLSDCSAAQTGTITHGTKSGGTNYTGRGVYVASNATFTMYGGSISGNTVNKSGGGVYVNGGTFDMSGGTISSNKAKWGGGGVYVNTSGSMTISGSASITGNTVGSGDTSSSGGGVYVNSGTFTMSGGTISGNNADQGGGVFLKTENNGSCTFTMSGGTISGNNADQGDGVTVYGNSTINMSGSAAITGNNGGGMYVDSSGTFNMAGNVQITSNWKNGTKNTNGMYEKGTSGSASNLRLGLKNGKSDDPITVGVGNLSSGARIGVNTFNSPQPGSSIHFATGASDQKVDYKQIFIPDAAENGYTVFRSVGDLYLAVHQHSWGYSLSEDKKTITATCTDKNCTNNNGGSVTIDKPLHETYGDGKSAEATLTKTNWAAGDVSVTYKKGEEILSSVPTDAGTYTASINLGGAEVSVEYTINKAKLTVTANDSTVTYGNTASGKGVTYSGFVNGENETVLCGSPTYTFGGYTTDADVGSNSFTITPSGLTSSNYDIEFKPGTLTVTQREVTLTWNNTDNRTYDDKKTVTATAGNLVNGDSIGVTVTDGTETAIGKHTATATGLTGTKAGNYKLPTSVTKDYMIGKAAAEVTTPPTAAELVYNGSEQNLISVGTATGGTLVYSTTENGTYSESIPTGTNADKYEVWYMVQGDDNHSGTAPVKLEVTISPKSLTADGITIKAETKTYTGNALTTNVTVKDGAKDLTPNTDYTITGYENNTNAGTAVVKLQGEGNYTGEMRKEWTIDPAGLYASGYSVANATYGTKLKDISIQVTVKTVNTDVTVNGTWAWDSSNDLDAIPNADTNDVFLAVFTPTSGVNNYKPLTAGISPTISKAEQSILLQKAYPQTKNGVGYDISKYAEVKGVEGGTAPGALSYELVGTPKGVSLVDNVLTVQPEATAETITVKVTASATENYKEATTTFPVELSDRPKNSDLMFEEATYTKNFGDDNFSVKVKGAYESTVTYSSDNEAVAKVNPTTGEVTIVGVGKAVITATGSATDRFAETTASYTLIVNQKQIAIPAKITTAFTYNGEEQTYNLSTNEAYTISGNKQTNANETGYTVTVALNDTTNTCWADGTTGDKTYSFVIGKAVITVKATDKSAYVGDAAPALTNPVEGTDYTVSALVGDDKLDVSTVVLAYAADPDMTQTGTAVITVTGGILPSENYKLAYAAGTLTITARPSSGGGGSVATTYPVNTPSKTENGSVSSTLKNASKGDTVTITVKPDSGYVLNSLTVTDSKGSALKLTDKGDGKYTFTMPAGKVEVNAAFAKETKTIPFSDVSTDAYYAGAVQWAQEKGITGGVADGLFGPDQSCTRAQIVTFLWRTAGSPAPKNAASFSDVSAGSYYAKAVAWAVEHGITSGVADGLFGPDQPCTRAQSVTFLFRASNAAADGTSAFHDVAADAYYAAAVKWATDNGITSGIGGGLFGPGSACTRAQIVTFLYKANQGT